MYKCAKSIFFGLLLLCGSVGNGFGGADEAAAEAAGQKGGTFSMMKLSNFLVLSGILRTRQDAKHTPILEVSQSKPYTKEAVLGGEQILSKLKHGVSAGHARQMCSLIYLQTHEKAQSQSMEERQANRLHSLQLLLILLHLSFTLTSEDYLPLPFPKAIILLVITYQKSIIVMDNFPIKRGIGISRAPHLHPHNHLLQRDLANKTQEQFPRNFQPQMTVMSRRPHRTADVKGQLVHSHTFSNTGVTLPAQQPKIPTTDPVFREQNFKYDPPVQPQLLQNNSIKPPNFPSEVFPYQLIHHEGKALTNVQNMLTVSQLSRSGENKSQNQQASNSHSISFKTDSSNSPIKEKAEASLPNWQYSPPILTVVQNAAIQTVQMNLAGSSLKIEETRVNVITKEKQELQQELMKIKQQNQAEKKELQQMLKDAKMQNNILQMQKQELQKRIEWAISQQNSSWTTEKQSLLKQVETQASTIKQLQFKLSQVDQQAKNKASALQYQLRLMKGNKNRLEIEIDSSKKLFKSQRQKNEKTREQMNKLMFFEDDLIHAKDYNKLKDELESALAENDKLVKEHSLFIVEVGVSRQAAHTHLKELEQQLNGLRAEYSEYRAKIQSCLQAGEDKMVILKLQSEINFLRKKIEEQTELLSSKEAELEDAKAHIRDLTAAQNDKKKMQSSTSFLDEISLWQIKDTVAQYEERMTDLKVSLAKQQEQAGKQRKTIELLTAELRKTRQEKNINSLKEKSCENSLKNDVDILQKGHQTEIELKNKKISNLEECIQRKAKEIGQKDKFIKDFLIGRLKQLDSCSIDSIFSKIKEYFEPQTKQSSQAEPPLPISQ